MPQTWYDPRTWSNPLSTMKGWAGDAMSWGEKSASTNLGDYRGQTQYTDRNQIQNAITAGLGTSRTAPQVSINPSDPFRNAQLGQLSQLQGIASGQQQGAGELAVQRQAQNALAAQQSMARMQRGPMAMLGQRDARDQSAAIGSTAMGVGQQAALGDQMAAQGMIAQAAGQGRGQDQSVQLANLNAQLQQMGMDDAARLGYLQQLTGMNAAELNAAVGAMGAAQAGNKPGYLPGLMQTAGQVGAAAAMASDENLKEEIADASDEVDAMLDNLYPKSYKYKDAKWGEGRRAGIMAQDLERSEAGKRIVMDTPEGKLLDVNKAISAALAGAARLNKRVRELERKAG